MKDHPFHYKENLKSLKIKKLKNKKKYNLKVIYWFCQCVIRKNE